MKTEERIRKRDMADLLTTDLRKLLPAHGRTPASARKREFRFTFARPALWLSFVAFFTFGEFVHGREAIPEYKLKASVMLNFARYTEWPEDAFATEEAPFIIGILGRDPFGTALDEVVRGRTLKGRPITVQRSRRFGDLRNTHILFLCDSERTRFHRIAEALAGTPVLTVADSDSFAERGGMVELYFRDRAIAFRINREAASNSGLIMDSRLLNLANIVGGNVEEEE